MRLTVRNQSVPMKALEVLSRIVPDLKGKHSLVIGNGEMGRMMAELLIKQGADVTMTLRQYKTFDAVIPEGAKVILYEERYDYLPKMDIVISATLSPHYTIKKGTVETLRKRGPSFDSIWRFRRDMDPGIERIE